MPHTDANHDRTLKRYRDDRWNPPVSLIKAIRG